MPGYSYLAGGHDDHERWRDPFDRRRSVPSLDRPLLGFCGSSALVKIFGEGEPPITRLVETDLSVSPMGPGGDVHVAGTLPRPETPHGGAGPIGGSDREASDQLLSSAPSREVLGNEL